MPYAHDHYISLVDISISLCTLWCIEALGRAGQYDKKMLEQAVRMFEVRVKVLVPTDTHKFAQDFLQYTNHVGLCTEEVSPSGDG